MKIKIDNQEYDFEENQTILEVARKNGIKIPTLCYLKGVCQDSSCRICVVEDLKSNRLILSCNTPCVDGMELLTNSERVIASRKKTLELMLSTHNKDCSSCKKSGYCKFQELLKEYKSEHLESFIYSSATVLYCSNAFSQVFDDISIPKPAPIQITEKVGRNEPCPCGSGKKFKNCCGKA